MNKLLILIGAAVVLAVIALIVFIPANQAPQVTSFREGVKSQTRSSQPAPATGTIGRVVFGVTDDLVSPGTLRSLNITIKEVWVQSPTKGWVLVSKTPRTFDLFQLHSLGATEFLADANLPVGNYNQVRLVVERVIAINADGTSQEAKLPSGDLKLIGDLEVIKGEISSVVFDFLVDKSLHITGNGKYIFAPVIKLDTRNNVGIQIAAKNQLYPNGKLEISNGRSKFNAVLGMDENGEIKLNGGINPNAKVEMVDGKIKVTPK